MPPFFYGYNTDSELIFFKYLYDKTGQYIAHWSFSVIWRPRWLKLLMQGMRVLIKYAPSPAKR